ncbi:MAG: hypothetical protein HDS02_08355 [Bacteroides sp.]|nr:hypothetical protein [Bacteroides sp.]
MAENKTMILAIGGAGGKVLDLMRRETSHNRLKETRYAFAKCLYNEDDLNNHLTDNSQQILLDYDLDEFPEDVFEGIEKLVVVAGLGGRTGTKYPELAVISARQHGVKEIAVIATLPFNFEGEKRRERSVSAAKRIQSIHGVRLFCLDNEELSKRYGHDNIINLIVDANKEIMKVLENAIENFYTIPVYELLQ